MKEEQDIPRVLDNPDPPAKSQKFRFHLNTWLAILLVLLGGSVPGLQIYFEVTAVELQPGVSISQEETERFTEITRSTEKPTPEEKEFVEVYKAKSAVIEKVAAFNEAEEKRFREEFIAYASISLALIGIGISVLLAEPASVTKEERHKLHQSLYALSLQTEHLRKQVENLDLDHVYTDFPTS